jgi:pyruvate kinase
MNRTTLKRMRSAGMNAVRINTAFGSIREYAKAVRLVKSVADMPILVDLKGPEIRLICRKEAFVARGSTIRVGSRPSEAISFNRSILSQLRVGDTVLLNKGKVRSCVVGRFKGAVKLKVLDECVLKSGSGVNVPSRRLDIKSLSRLDMDILRKADTLKIDYVALSFTRNTGDIRHLKSILGGRDIGVIAKIESQEGVDNVESILKECDGVMIARGDLGIEVPSERIPMIQKGVIARCNQLGKVSIVATEMLHTMIENPEPTRAETSDVANAILDGADAIMLSGESAIGKYPVRAVKTMSKIAHEVESHMSLKPLDEELHDKVPLAISKAVAAVIGTVEVDKIVVATHTGYTAMLISNFRICKDIVAITDSAPVFRRLQLVYAVQPIVHPYFKSREKILEIARYSYNAGLVAKNDLVLITAGVYTSKPTTNIIQLHRVKELLEYGKKAR